MKDQKKAVDVLNTLVEINNDRIEGYETAKDETKESDLRTVFDQFINTSKNCRKELANEISRLGGTPDEGTKLSGKFFRVWMDVKVALSTNDRKAILNSCETGEEAAVKTYDKVLEKQADEITADHVKMISVQRSAILADLDKIKQMRDSLVAH